MRWFTLGFAPSLAAFAALSLTACGNGEIGAQTPESSGGQADPASSPGDPSSPAPTPVDPAAPVNTLGGDPAEVTPSVPAEFDLQASRAAFEQYVYPTLSANCSTCHSSASKGQLPFHSDVDVATAHDYALGLTDLRRLTSRLITRLGIDGHNCWSDCIADSEVMRQNIEAWAGAIDTSSLAVDENIPETLSEADVVAWIQTDRAQFSADDLQYIKYVSLHTLVAYGENDNLDLARAGLSKVLNSLSRYAPEIVNPVAVEGSYNLVYRFDIRDYWGYTGVLDDNAGRGRNADAVGTPNAEVALAAWERIAQGITEFSDDDTQMVAVPDPADETGETLIAADPYIDGFFADYVEVTQLAYTLTRPNLYNELLAVPRQASTLEAAIGVDPSIEYLYMTVNEAITIGQRLMWRTNTPDGYYWRSVDQFSQRNFVFYDYPVPVFSDPTERSQIITTPNVGQDEESTLDEELYSGIQGEEGRLARQAQANEVIWSLPNGLQAYGIFGAGNQRRVDAFTFIVVDPRRGGAIDENGSFRGRNLRGGEEGEWRLLNGASCISCHMDGMNRAPDDMRPYIEANPTGTWTAQVTPDGVAATREIIEQLYPGSETMGQVIEADRSFFMGAMQQITNGIMVGTNKTLVTEPVMYLFEAAQQIYGYRNTISN